MYFEQQSTLSLSNGKLQWSEVVLYRVTMSISNTKSKVSFEYSCPDNFVTKDKTASFTLEACSSTWLITARNINNTILAIWLTTSQTRSSCTQVLNFRATFVANVTVLPNHKESFGGTDDVNIINFSVIQEVNVFINSVIKTYFENAHKVSVEEINYLVLQKSYQRKPSNHPWYIGWRIHYHSQIYLGEPCIKKLHKTMLIRNKKDHLNTAEKQFLNVSQTQSILANFWASALHFVALTEFSS